MSKLKIKTASLEELLEEIELIPESNFITSYYDSDKHTHVIIYKEFPKDRKAKIISKSALGL